MAAVARQPVETPPAKVFGFACEPPGLPGFPPPGKRSCPLKHPEHASSYELIVEVDAQGRTVTAMVAEERSPEVDGCILEEAREWTFAPARRCDGQPVPGIYRTSYAVVFGDGTECSPPKRGPAFASVAGGRTIDCRGMTTQF